MLKITTVHETPESLKVELHGKFTGEYLPELEKALSGQSTRIQKVALDLANVTFVDRAAMEFLCLAKSRNVAVENTPSYVARWIEQESRRRSAHCDPPAS